MKKKQKQQLRQKSIQELRQELVKVQKEQTDLQMRRTEEKNTNALIVLRRSIARIYTLIREQELQSKQEKEA